MEFDFSHTQVWFDNDESLSPACHREFCGASRPWVPGLHGLRSSLSATLERKKRQRPTPEVQTETYAHRLEDGRKDKEVDWTDLRQPSPGKINTKSFCPFRRQQSPLFHTLGTIVPPKT